MIDPPSIDTCRIPLGRGRFALVDASDYPLLVCFRWRALKVRHTWYAVTVSDGKRELYMHDLIMEARAGRPVDHRNGKGSTTTARFCASSPTHSIRPTGGRCGRRRGSRVSLGGTGNGGPTSRSISASSLWVLRHPRGGGPGLRRGGSSTLRRVRVHQRGSGLTVPKITNPALTHFHILTVIGDPCHRS